MSTEITERFIDLEQVFRSKSPRVANAIPGFVFRYLRRIVHEKEINAFLYQNRDNLGLDFVQAIIDRFQLEPQVYGLTPELIKGNCIVAANHPLGGLDGVTLMHVLGKIRPDLLSPSNDLLMNLPNMRKLFVGINKHGSNADNIQAFDEVFAGPSLIMYFPAGLVSRKQQGVIRDLEWKPTFIKKAVKHHRDIVPVHIGGHNSEFFYNLALWRKRLGIKANLEMLYLADEVFKLKDKRISLRFGQPIPWQTFDRSRKAHEWAAIVKDHVYRLAETNDPGSIEFKH